MNMKFLLLSGLILFFFLGSVLINAPEVSAQGDRPMSTPDKRVSRELWDIWRQGFEFYEKGEMKMISGKYEEAIPFYQKSLDSFTEVQKQNPQWNRSVIEYRLNLCRRRLFSAKQKAEETADEIRRTARSSETPSEKVSVATDASAAQEAADRQAFDERLKKVSQENELRKKQIENLQTELTKLRPDAERGDAALKQIKGLMDERDQLDKQLTSLRLQFEKLQEEQKKVTPRAAELEKLLAAEQTKSTAYSKAFRDRSTEFTQLEERMKALASDKAKREDAFAELTQKYNASLKTTENVLSQNAEKVKSMTDALKTAESNLASLNAKLQESTKQYNEAVAEVSKLILEINPAYAYPHMLVSTCIEGVYHQRYFASHLPSLTDKANNADTIQLFYKDLIFKAIRD